MTTMIEALSNAGVRNLSDAINQTHRGMLDPADLDEPLKSKVLEHVAPKEHPGSGVEMTPIEAKADGTLHEISADEPQLPSDRLNVAQTIAWVDANPQHAQAVLDRELAKAKPRKSLIADLTGEEE